MAKKSITIQSIDEELYQQFKAESSRRGYKLSEFVEEIFKHIVAGEIFSGSSSQGDSSKCDEIVNLKTQIVELNKANTELREAAKQSNACAYRLKQEYDDLKQEHDDLKQECNNLAEDAAKYRQGRSEVIKELENKLDLSEYDKNNLQRDKAALQDELNDLQDDYAALSADFDTKEREIVELREKFENRQEPTRGIVVAMPELETKLIYYVCDRESERVGKEITPALLLQTMFVNFAFHGDTWFFPIPKKAEIRRLQAEIDADKAAERKEEAGDE